MNAAMMVRAGAADERRHQAGEELARIGGDYYAALSEAAPSELEDFLEAISSAARAPVREARNKFLRLALVGNLYEPSECRAAVEAFRALVREVGGKWAEDSLEAARIEQAEDAAQERYQNRMDAAHWMGVGS